MKAIFRFIITFRRTELLSLLKIADWQHEIVDQYIPIYLKCITDRSLATPKYSAGTPNPLVRGVRDSMTLVNVFMSLTRENPKKMNSKIDLFLSVAYK